MSSNARSPSASRSNATNDDGVSLGQHPHARLGGMDPLQQRVEVEAAAVAVGHHDLAVDDAPVGQSLEERLEQLGEVAVERPLVAAGELDLVAVAEHDAAEAVPLRLVQPPVAGRDLAGELRQHRLDRRGQRQRHVELTAPSVPHPHRSVCFRWPVASNGADRSEGCSDCLLQMARGFI